MSHNSSGQDPGCLLGLLRKQDLISETDAF